jgi:aminoglycoside phosphotransferase (APT) family kinase protein
VYVTPGISVVVVCVVCPPVAEGDPAAVADETMTAARAAAMSSWRSTTLGEGSPSPGRWTDEDGGVSAPSRLALIRETLGREPDSIAWVQDGYDFEVALVDAEWVFRFPRRAVVAEALEVEIVLLPALAPVLPVAVPHFEHVLREPEFVVVYRLIEGEPIVDEDPAGVAAFLSALHAFDPDGQPVERPDWREAYADQCARFERTVMPLLDPDERRRGARFFAGVETLEGFTPALLHADLGSVHLRCRGGRLVGVIDWGDTRIGDPALDFSWLLHDHPRGNEILAAYEGTVDGGFSERALFYHRLAPWYEADYGLVVERPVHVAASLAEIRARLP